MIRWHCTACGYVHEGGEPPERCPWCGAPSAQFTKIDRPGLHSPLYVPVHSTEEKSMKTWVCTVCGYREDGEEPPDFCPDCGAPKERFVEI